MKGLYNTLLMPYLTPLTNIYQRILLADASMNTSIQEIHEHTASEGSLFFHSLHTLYQFSKTILCDLYYWRHSKPCGELSVLQDNTLRFSLIGHFHNISTMQFFIGISKNTQSKAYTLSLTKCAENSEIMHCGILISMPY